MGGVGGLIRELKAAVGNGVVAQGQRVQKDVALVVFCRRHFVLGAAGCDREPHSLRHQTGVCQPGSSSLSVLVFAVRTPDSGWLLCRTDSDRQSDECTELPTGSLSFLRRSLPGHHPHVLEQSCPRSEPAPGIFILHTLLCLETAERRLHG
ncbi:unnamed protein product [Pleuronectes platessa]|uniref:Uncharacterized protein n=1 Tax=Pleuronectes platessa TaxID=8262 RepID=A0A9N7VBD8_PLEPL|nr:unnamed protein product [Pleuronectes platessa]